MATVVVAVDFLAAGEGLISQKAVMESLHTLTHLETAFSPSWSWSRLLTITVSFLVLDSDVNKYLTFKAKDTDQSHQTLKAKDQTYKDKDQTSKDKDQTFKAKDQDKD